MKINRRGTKDPDYDEAIPASRPNVMPGVLTHNIVKLRAVVILYDCNIKKLCQKCNSVYFSQRCLRKEYQYHTQESQQKVDFIFAYINKFQLLVLAIL